MSLSHSRAFRRPGGLQRRARAAAARIVALALCILCIVATTAQAQIDSTNWGTVTTPVFGSDSAPFMGAQEGGVYAGAELFAGPNKFGEYYFGVLPNGRVVLPAGTVAQIGMNPLGCALTPDGRFLITSNDDERDGGLVSLQNPANVGGYSLTVLDTSTSPPTIVSQISTAGRFFIGLQVTGSGPYTVWASGGPDNDIKLFHVSAAGAISIASPSHVVIPPITPMNAGFVSNYTPAATFAAPFKPAGFMSNGAKTTFPAGSALSGKYLYVACNGDNSVAVIDTTTSPPSIVQQVPVGYFPYGVAVSRAGKIAVSNWGVTEYKFKSPHYDGSGNLTGIDTTAGNVPDGFYVVPTSTGGAFPKTSSISLLTGGGAATAPLGAIYLGQPGGIDALSHVGDTHPSATAIVRRGSIEVLYVTKSNSDCIGLILLNNSRRLPDFDLSPIGLTLLDGHKVHGAYPNALAVSPDNSRVYVAEAGLNSVAVLDTTDPTNPRLLGRIPTGWYPTGLALSPDGTELYVTNARGIGEDINPATVGGPHNPTGVESFSDGNFIFGTVQKIDLPSALATLDNTTVLGYNFAMNPPADTAIVPIGGPASNKIKHVIFILHENKTFDSMLGNQAHFGPYASTMYNTRAGAIITNTQFTPVVPNIQTLANSFATAANYFSDSEESDAGHQFCMSGTASDYTEKTILLKGPNDKNGNGRGLLVNKNFEVEDYPEGGYIFNNAARNGVNFKEYGIEAARIIGSDTGGAIPTQTDDPPSGNAGYPALPVTVDPITHKVVNVPNSDVTSPTQGVGESFFMKYPGLAVLGSPNPNGSRRIDRNYPGYNFNISDQRRAREFCKDFDAMVAAGNLPEFLYIYQPNDHTGGPYNAKNVPAPTAAQQVADGDVGLGMVIKHIMSSPVYYDAGSDTGSAIFITFDDAQSTLDHIHEHRTPLVVVSPFSRTTAPGTGNGYVGRKHYSTASIVKTEELLLGLPPNNLGDLFATDLRDLFQDTYNGLKASDFVFTSFCKYTPSSEGRKIWALVKNLDTSAPDRDSHRLGVLARLSMEADRWHAEAVKKHHLKAKPYHALQARLYAYAVKLTQGAAPRDADD